MEVPLNISNIFTYKHILWNILQEQRKKNRWKVIIFACCELYPAPLH